MQDPPYKLHLTSRAEDILGFNFKRKVTKQGKNGGRNLA
jgi:hypothetical protein